MRYRKDPRPKTQNPKLPLAIALVAVAIISGCGRAPIVKKTKPLMGTWVSIKAYDAFRNPERIKEFIDEAFSGMERVEGLMSSFLPDSEISHINRLKPGRSIKVSRETLSVLDKAGRIHEVTDGAFDITIAPLTKLWSSHEAGEAEINQTLELIGQDKLLVDKEYGYVGLSRYGMELDLGGIAKGFAVDEAVNILKRNGVRNALVDAGGDIYCLGSNPDKKSWRVGVKHPRKNKMMTTLRLKDMAVATSGDYENFIDTGGKRLSHIIDPRTGCPVREKPIGVTVLAKDCATADALATALSVMDAEEGLSLVNEMDYVEAIIISDNGGSLKVDLSEGLEGLYEFEK